MTVKVKIINEDNSWDARKVTVYGVNPKSGFRIEGQKWEVSAGRSIDVFIHEHMSVEVRED